MFSFIIFTVYVEVNMTTILKNCNFSQLVNIKYSLGGFALMLMFNLQLMEDTVTGKQQEFVLRAVEEESSFTLDSATTLDQQTEELIVLRLGQIAR